MVAPHSNGSGPFWPLQPLNGSLGMSVKLASNFFQISCDPKEGLFTYDVTFSPDLVSFSQKEVSKIEAALNARMDIFTPFFRRGKRLFSRKEVSGFVEQVSVQLDDGSTADVSVAISGVEGLYPIPAKSKDMQVLYSYILDKLVSFKAHQKLGNLFYNRSQRDNEKLQVVGGFSCSAGFMQEVGHYLTVDSLYRAVHRKNVLESMMTYIDSLVAELPLDGSSQLDVQGEWRRRCENAQVFAYNNGRMYRVKRVRFDLSASSPVALSGKKARGVQSPLSFVDFYRRFYNRIVYDPNQPLLECFAEKRSETVLLVPELCALTGLTDEMKKDRMLMQEVLQYSRVGTGDKLNQCVAICRDIFSGSVSAPVIDSSSSSGKARQLMKDWKCQLSQVPARLEARVLEPCEVSFGGQKRYVVEDGNFQRWTRNGSQCPMHLSRWIVVHAEQDRQLVDMWLRSMRELGMTGFGMHFGDPMRFIMSGNPEELRRILLDQVTPDVQLVMMFTPQKDSNRLYKILKHVTTTVRPCITQVVKSETMRKRQSVVAIVTRVVMQISAKLLAPLWHVSLETPHTPMMAEPTMLVGIDSFENKEFPRKSVIGFVASMDAFVSQYFSTTVMIDEIPRDDPHKYFDRVAQKVRLCMHEAFEAFADANEGMLPTNIIVYRNSVSRQDMKRIGQFEIEAILDSVRATISETWENELTQGAKNKECAYDPHLTYIMCMKHVPARFFMMGAPEGAKNPPPGTVLDPVAPGSDHYSFFLVNQHVSRGAAAPTQYVVGYDSSGFSVDAIQNLTFKLSHMYYNFPGGVRLPAPAQYAKKLAHMVATSVQADIHPRLRETLFYL